MTDVPSECELMDLSHEICSVWMNVGIRLGLKKSTLDNIAGTPSLDTPQKKAFEMLIKWRQLQTTSHLAQLVSALELEGREDLGQKYSTYQQVRYVWYVFEWWSLHRLHIEFVSGISSKRPFMVDMLRIQHSRLLMSSVSWQGRGEHHRRISTMERVLEWFGLRKKRTYS